MSGAFLISVLTYDYAALLIHPSDTTTGLFDPKDVSQKPSLELFCQNLESWNQPFSGVQAKETQ